MNKMFAVVSLMMKEKWAKGVMRMKTKIAVLTLLICFVMVTTAVKADVLLPTNGDFEGGTHVGRGGNIMPLLWDNANNIIDGGWGNPTVDEDYNDGGYVVAQVDGTNPTPGGYAVVYQIDSMSLASLGFPEQLVPFYIEFSADINDLIPGGGGPGAILKAEYYSDLAGIALITSDERQITTSGSTWANYEITDFYVPTDTKSLKFVFGVSTGWAGQNAKPSKFAFDNLRIGYTYFDTYPTPALYPVPIIGGAKNPADKVISWTNPEGAVNADVYLQESATPIAYPADPRINGTRIAHDTTAQSLTVPSIQPNMYYYWVVDVNMGSEVAQGLEWNFQTAEMPPTVNAGADQYLVETASPMTLTLDANATDDHGITTYAWTDITAPGDKDPATVVTIVSPTTEDTNVILTNTTGSVSGYYQFTLTVTDTASQTTADTVAVGVYGTCAEAAIADPDDDYDGIGDFNGDCKVDFNDFGLFAVKWLNCDSLRIPCP